MPLIKVILGSTRPSRFGTQPAAWLMELAKEHKNATFELVDLAEVNLPLLDESELPSSGIYSHEHTKQWAKTIGEADGYIIVTAEYNYSIPGALKNAIDFVSNEWAYKPVAFVSYGSDAGGARAVEHLRGAAGWLRLYDIREHVLIANYWQHMDEDGTFQPTEHHATSANAMLNAVAFWAEHLKPGREALQKQQ